MGVRVEIEQAQRDVRMTYVGGSVGQLVWFVIWPASAMVGTWGSHRTAALLLVFGGVLIFPLTQLVLRLMGRRFSLRRGYGVLFEVDLDVAITGISSGLSTGAFSYDFNQPGLTALPTPEPPSVLLLLSGIAEWSAWRGYGRRSSEWCRDRALSRG